MHKKPLPPPPAIVFDFRPDLTEDQVDVEVFIDVGAGGDTPVVWEPTIEPEPTIIEPVLVYIVEEMPSFPGGYNAMMSFLAKNIVYPTVAKEVHITGRVYIEFTVEKDGSISNIIVLKGIGGGCEEEAIRVVRMMPRWNPGKQNGIPERVRLTLPIKFSLI